jgi:hypothetical protein
MNTRCWWLMPIIVAIRDPDIRKIAVQGQPRQKVLQTLSQQKKLGMVAHTCHSSYCRKHK